MGGILARMLGVQQPPPGTVAKLGRCGKVGDVPKVAW
jgi:hypothetical protein